MAAHDALCDDAVQRAAGPCGIGVRCPCSVASPFRDIKAHNVMHSNPGTVWNLAHLEEQHARWQADPASVEREWQVFFQGFHLGLEREATPLPAAAPATATDSGRAGRGDQQRADALIYTYRDIGHTVCQLDPLGINNQSHNPNLELTTFGFGDADLDREFAADSIYGMPSRALLRDIITALRQTYCGTIGAEYQHIQDRERRHWVRQAVEQGRNQPALSRDEKLRILLKLNQADTLETFIHTRFLGQKRFSIEGGDALIPALDAIIENAPEQGLEEIVMGMAHRGRLTVLSTILNKTYEHLFTEFEGTYDLADLQGDGDVKYHQGFTHDHVTRTGKTVHLTLSANPSHLEAVNPVVLGRVRGKQRQRSDTAERAKVMPILLHGDAAFAGQGAVMEVFQLAQLEGYTVGGTIHVISNNQIGFTTLPADSRSTRYCSDLAKMFDAPVLHVNGDDPEAVVHCAKLALTYRQRFKRDVVIDIVCYRRHGHNESDEPNYTQPTLYAKIARHPRVKDSYRDRLLADGVIDQAEAEAMATIQQNQLQDALNTIKQKPARIANSRFKGVWQGLSNQYGFDAVDTRCPADVLDQIGKALSTWPTDFAIHPKIRKMAEDRGKVIASRGRVEWALGEMLAFGALLTEGTPVRLSGQDCRRGTFSQRHSYWYDINTRARYKPLNHIRADQANLCVYNSPLIEAAVLGFDYGYSISEPNMLIIWEAQFGDFVNGAQVIIDQFLTSSESKWGRVSGMVMMLPHGQEGAGPEHSSARLERFLQAAAEDNIQVAYCTTAAQHFHILRRQMKRKFRKPLVLMTPKSHLRSKAAASDFAEFTDGGFKEVIGDIAVDAGKVERLVLCTGKVYHDLNERRAEAGITNTAIVRVEAALPPQRGCAQRRRRSVRQSQAGRVVPGRAAEHGRLVLHGAAPAPTARPRHRLCRPRGRRQPRPRQHGPVPDRTGAAHRRCLRHHGEEGGEGEALRFPDSQIPRFPD